MWEEGEFSLEDGWCGCSVLIVDEFINFCMKGVFRVYYFMIIFDKCCIGVRCGDVPFGGLVRLANRVISVLVHILLK